MSDLELTNSNLGNEIDLKDLLLKIKKHIFKILIFVFLVVSCTLMYVLSLPNIYKSSLILSPQGGSSSKSSSGGLSSLASFAGISLGSKSGGQDPYLLMTTTLHDYKFNKHVIQKYDLINKLNNSKDKLVFALGIDTFYSLRNKEVNNQSKTEENYFYYYKKLIKIVSLSSNKKTGLIYLSAMHKDRFLANELVNIYLKELTSFIKKNDMKDFDKQIAFYKDELRNARDISLKEQLSKSLSGLFQKKVFSKVNEYYFVSKLTDSRVAFTNEKVNPKRAKILIISMFISLILGIVLAISFELIRNEKK